MAVAPLRSDEAEAEASIIDGESIRSFDPDSELIPARIAGRLDGVEPGDALALALNGRVAATTYAYEGDYGTEFGAMVPPAVFTPARRCTRGLPRNFSSSSAVVRTPPTICAPSSNFP